MKHLNILFLGASKLVTLFERFLDSSKKIGVNLNIFSCEKKLDFYPISHLATIIEGPSFLSDGFQEYLLQNLIKHNINIVIPNMDSATVALSHCKSVIGQLENKVWLVVSDIWLCQAMYNKAVAAEFFNLHGISTPSNTPGRFPKLMKPITGYASKGIIRVETEDELQWHMKRCVIDEYIVQDLILGQETSLDFYVSPTKGLIGYVLRDTLEMSDGKIIACTTREPVLNEKELLEKLAKLQGWEGCISVQYIRNESGIYVIEINPRFAGGSTCTIEAGLNMPMFILSEYLGENFEIPTKMRSIKMNRAMRDFFYGI